MLRGVDHLVIAVQSLESATKDYADVGFTVVPGGRHTGIGTYNSLIAFEDGSYLELIGFYEPRDDHRWFAPLRKGGGLVDFCLQTDDLPGDTVALRRAGIDIGEPEKRDRKRPDGKEIRWMFSLARGAHRGVAIGPHTFDFVAPATPSSPLTAWLAGPRPVAVRGHVHERRRTGRRARFRKDARSASRARVSRSGGDR